MLSRASGLESIGVNTPANSAELDGPVAVMMAGPHPLPTLSMAFCIPARSSGPACLFSITTGRFTITAAKNGSNVAPYRLSDSIRKFFADHVSTRALC